MWENCRGVHGNKWERDMTGMRGLSCGFVFGLMKYVCCGCGDVLCEKELWNCGEETTHVK